MAFYRICPDCGAHLDPGETCDCRVEQEHMEKEKQRRESEIIKMLTTEKNGQLRMAI